MEGGKIITINPELFSLSNSTTRKKRPTQPKELKIKEPKKQSTKTMRNKLLHYIRKTQEDNFRKFHGREPEITAPVHYKTDDVNFTNDFEESLKYLNEVADNVKNTVPKNYTLRTVPQINTIAPLSAPFVNDISSLPLHNVIQPSSETFHINQTKPAWGCLKGGALPTYRSWTQQSTQKNQPQITVTNPNTNSSIIPPRNMPILSQNQREPMITDMQREIIKKTQEKIQQEQTPRKQLRYAKRKKTIRRTYRVGKSKTIPKIGVLISNKTIRNTISTKKQHLKQIPIEQIRKTLITKGFIKVGSIAPNDVLRQMYESMSLICGEVQNHNPDNLVYNFFNASS
jgi:hypothetical protein